MIGIHCAAPQHEGIIVGDVCTLERNVHRELVSPMIVLPRLDRAGLGGATALPNVAAAGNIHGLRNRCDIETPDAGNSYRYIHMTERHYNDDEVAAIFRAATEGSNSRALPGGSTDGLTLQDLQAIARDVGISPSAVSHAAHSLDHVREPVVSRTFLGFPIAVQRTIAFDRRLTDAEWELLVVELRQVFHARGTMRAQGSMREWSNGNLQALLEPTATGHQLRLGTFKGNARPSLATGLLALGVAAVAAVALTATRSVGDAAPVIALLTTVGAVLVANGTLMLPRWARQRAQQMDGIVDRLALKASDMR